MVNKDTIIWYKNYTLRTPVSEMQTIQLIFPMWNVFNTLGIRREANLLSGNLGKCCSIYHWKRPQNSKWTLRSNENPTVLSFALWPGRKQGIVTFIFLWTVFCKWCPMILIYVDKLIWRTQGVFDCLLSTLHCTQEAGLGIFGRVCCIAS